MNDLRGASSAWPVTVAATVTVVVIVVGAVNRFTTVWQLATVVSVFLVIFLAFSKPSAMHIGLAASLYLFSQTHYSRIDSTTGELSRLMALVVILVAASRVHHASSDRKPTELLALMGFGIVAYAWAIFASLPSDGVTTSFVSFSLACWTLIVAARTLPVAWIRTAIERVLAIALVLSLLSAAIFPGTAFAGGRLEGIFANANTLGFFASLGLLACITHTRSKFPISLFALSGVCLILAGSRSPLLGLVVAAILASVNAAIRAERSSARILIFTAIGSFLGYIAMTSVLAKNLDILRVNNSREIGTDYAMTVASTNIWRGIGFGNSEIEIASTPLRWLAEVGVVGLVCVLAAYILIMYVAWNHSWQAVTFAAFGVVHSVFEGWYFAGGSGLFFTFWLLYASVGRSSGDPDSDEFAITSTKSDIR